MKPKTLRSYRFLAMLAGQIVLLGAFFSLLLAATLRGGLSADSYLRAVVSLIGLLVLLAGIVCLAAALRSRAILDDEGVTLVGVFGRRWFAWADITEITLHTNTSYWEMFVRTADAERRAFIYPIVSAKHKTLGERHTSPPPYTPDGLAKLYAHLQVHWDEHRTPAR